VATKTNTPQQYALLQFGDRALLLSPEDAALVFPALCRGLLLKKTWSNGYRFVKETDADYHPTIRPYSLAEYAEMELASDAPNNA